MQPDTAREALERAIAFIAKEYRDPALEPAGEWLPTEARKVHAQLVAALASEGPGRVAATDGRGGVMTDESHPNVYTASFYGKDENGQVCRFTSTVTHTDPMQPMVFNFTDGSRLEFPPTTRDK